MLNVCSCSSEYTSPSYPLSTEYKSLSPGNEIVVFTFFRSDQPRKLSKESETEILSICIVDGCS